jgi:hypothetical protein
MKIVFTPRQIVQRIGKSALCKQLQVSGEAPRKWYAQGIPTKHWPALVKNHSDWLTYEILEKATEIARLPIKKR